MTRHFNAPALFALCLVVLNTIYASQIVQMSLPFSRGEPGPAFMPMILSGMLYIIAARIFFLELRADPVLPADDVASPVVPRLAITGPLIVVMLTALFVATFDRVGYVVSAAAYTFLISFFFNYEQTGNWRSAAGYAGVTAALITLFGWLFFAKLFDLYLPTWGF